MSAKTGPRPANRKVIEISKPLHDWLSTVKQEREQELGRQVTFTEVLEQLTAIHRPVKHDGT